MKIKQHLVITNIENFVKGDYYSCFTLFGDKDAIGGIADWFYAGEIEIEVTLPIEEARAKALELLEKERKVLLANQQRQLEAIENRKRNLLALTHNPEPEYIPRQTPQSIFDDDIPF